GGSREGYPPPRGRWLREVWDSTIGKKIVVAITGLILAGYVVLHVLGNLKAFQGDGSGGAPLDDYAEWLRTVGSPAVPRDGILWLVRILLIAALILHVAAITALVRRNRAARPDEQRTPPKLERTFSSRTMMFTGIFILAFTVFHILQFTTRTIQVTPVYQGTVYANVDAAFQKWYLVLLYVGAVVSLGFHLRHAIWSTTQTLGWDKPNRNNSFRRFATGLAVAITVGFASVPVCFYLDILPDPPSTQAVAQR
ncbi:MAG: succinate dehydrogenase cytochrome b subunit, partial [Actinobacteria bacterium]|nr:succinate dehydrogenase cytochrome b subunit [Actinomycetota bacterium]